MNGVQLLFIVFFTILLKDMKPKVNFDPNKFQFFLYENALIFCVSGWRIAVIYNDETMVRSL